MNEIATLGGGCFWCIEAALENLIGVDKVVSGYSGGHVEHPSYRQVCGKQTGHVEAVQVHFDPKKITYSEILEVFWAVHDPTIRDRQGNDAGPQYRSVIYYHNQIQNEQALASLESVAKVIYDDPIVTDILPLKNFYIAESEHQEFYRSNPNYGYCRVVIDPKVAKVRAKFVNRLKPA